jgi:hypothetical protein
VAEKVRNLYSQLGNDPLSVIPHLMSSEPPRKKKRSVLPKFILVKPPGIGKQKVNHHHVRYSTNSSGSLSTSSSTIQTEVQVVQPQTANQQETEQDISRSSVAVNEDDDRAVDGNYLEHIEELEPEEKTKRIRPKGVCSLNDSHP